MKYRNMLIVMFFVGRIVNSDIQEYRDDISSTSLEFKIKRLNELHYEFLQNYIKKGLSSQQQKELVQILENRRNTLCFFRDTHLRVYYPFYVGIVILSSGFLNRPWQIEEKTYFDSGAVKSITYRTSKSKMLFAAVCFSAMFIALNGLVIDLIFEKRSGDEQLKRIDELLALIEQ